MSEPKSLCTAERKYQVDQQLDNTDHSIEQLHKAVESLIARLQPVINLGNDSGLIPSDAPECVLVPIANRIRSIDHTINTVCAKIAAARDALEI